jgi:hypothetical protein
MTTTHHLSFHQTEIKESGNDVPLVLELLPFCCWKNLWYMIFVLLLEKTPHTWWGKQT